MQVTECTIKSGPNTGATYFVATRRDYGALRYTVDKKTGWHKSTKDARLYAEAKGWMYVTNRHGDRTLVHESARIATQHMQQERQNETGYRP